MKGSRPPRDSLDPARLFEATEAILLAIRDVEEHTGKPCPYPTELLGSAIQPDNLKEFTRFEIEQAAEFLVRMGVLKVSTSG